jgi:hypothetical protein
MIHARFSRFPGKRTAGDSREASRGRVWHEPAAKAPINEMDAILAEADGLLSKALIDLQPGRLKL